MTIKIKDRDTFSVHLSNMDIVDYLYDPPTQRYNLFDIAEKAHAKITDSFLDSSERFLTHMETVQFIYLFIIEFCIFVSFIYLKTFSFIVIFAVFWLYYSYLEIPIKI